MAPKQKKKTKKGLNLEELIEIEKVLHSKYSKVVNNILDLAKKEKKKGKLKTQADRLRLLEEKLIEVDSVIAKQTKIEKKLEKEEKKREAKKKAKAAKKEAAESKKIKVQPKKVVVAKKTSASPSPENTSSVSVSTDLNAKMAIAALQHIDTAESVTNFIKGEKRSTVLARAHSRINALK